MVMLSVSHSTLDGALFRWRKQLEPCLATKHVLVFISIAEDFTLRSLYFHVKEGYKRQGLLVLDESSYSAILFTPEVLISNKEGAKFEVYCNPCLKWSFPHLQKLRSRGCKMLLWRDLRGKLLSQWLRTLPTVSIWAGHSLGKHKEACVDEKTIKQPN